MKKTVLVSIILATFGFIGCDKIINPPALMVGEVKITPGDRDEMAQNIVAKSLKTANIKTDCDGAPVLNMSYYIYDSETINEGQNTRVVVVTLNTSDGLRALGISSPVVYATLTEQIGVATDAAIKQLLERTEEREQSVDSIR